MSTSPGPIDLTTLGDALTGSAERDLRSRRRRPIRRIALAVVVVAVVGTGTAAAASLLSPKQVAEAMPAGAVIFDQTDPTCVAGSDGSVFHCTLASAPSADSGISEYSGTKEVLVAGGVVVGGCIGQDAAGLTWDCYLGQDAVDKEIVSKDFLGEPAGPGRG